MEHATNAPPCASRKASRAGELKDRPWPPGLTVLAAGIGFDGQPVVCELRLWQRHLFTLYGPLPRDVPVRIRGKLRRSVRKVAAKLRRWGYAVKVAKSPKGSREP